MTCDEATRLLNEHRSLPVFIRGRQRYSVRPDGRVDIERAVGGSGQRWTWELTVNRSSYALPFELRTV